MKRLVNLLTMAFLLALVPVTNLAAQTPQDEQAVMDIFPLGMSKADALKAGAEENADDGDVLLYRSSWLGAEWISVLMLEKDELTTLAMRTALDHRTITSVLQYLTENSYEIMNITDVDGEDTSFFELKAEGKSDEALSDAYDKAMVSFAAADQGSCRILLCLDETLNEMADVIKNKGDEDAFLEKKKDNVAYAIDLDKDDDTMLLVVSTFGTMMRE